MLGPKTYHDLLFGHDVTFVRNLGDATIEEAAKWLLLAKKQNYPKAIERVNSSRKAFYDEYIKVSGINELEQKIKAINMLKNSAYMMYPLALLELSHYYKTGLIFQTFEYYECLEEFEYTSTHHNGMVHPQRMQKGARINKLSYDYTNTYSHKYGSRFPTEIFKTVYSDHEIVKMDSEMYIHYLKLAIINGSVEAKNEICEFCYDTKKWNSMIEVYSSTGISDKEIKRIIALFYEQKGKIVDLEESIKWYTSVQEPITKTLHKRLGDLYYHQQNWIDFQKNWVLAGISEKEAKRTIAVYYEQRTTVQDWEEAIKWYTASNESITHLQKRIGDWYNQQKSVEEWKIAISWYQLANISTAELQNRLGNHYNSFLGNYTIAKQWYLLAANQNYPEAEYHLGMFYKKEKKYIEAEELLCRSANSGYRDAKIELYSDRPYTQIAFEFMLKRANENHCRAQYCIGKNYANGFIVEKNSDVANKWYNLAYQNGYTRSRIIGDNLRHFFL